MSKDRSEVMVWERKDNGQRVLKKYDAPYYFYIESDKGPYRDINGRTLRKLEFSNNHEFYSAKEEYKADDVKLYESDINPIYKILSEKYYNKKIGNLNYTFFDIEVDYKPDKGFPLPEECYAEVNAISLYHSKKDEMVLLVLLPDNGKWTAADIPQDCHDNARVVICKNEIDLLTKFFEEIADSDILSGWNSDGFDIPYLYYRVTKIMGKIWANKLCFAGAHEPRIKEVEVFGNPQNRIELSGRVHVDYLELFKKFETTTRPSFTLDAISEEVLPEEKKMEFECSLYELYYDYFPDFCRYNIRDTVVLKGFERKLGYMGIAIATYHSATALMNDVLGTVRIVESTMINKCHYVLNTILPDSKEPTMLSGKFAGALVIDPNPGLHEWTASTDFKSLYPSIIRTLNISPEKIIGQFHNDFVAYEEISKKSEKPLTIIYEDNSSETHKAFEWATILKDKHQSLSGYGTVFDQSSKGFIPDILAEWYDERVKYRKLSAVAKDNMKALAKKYDKGETMSLEDTKAYEAFNVEKEYYHKLQFIKKILLNSAYGCLGNMFFKFYDIRMAESTTRSGREALLHMLRTVANILIRENKYQWGSAQNLPSNFRFPCEHIIYGDTDSAYFSLSHFGIDNAEDAFDMAKLIEAKINIAMQKFTGDHFFCSEEYTRMLVAELDVIADKSIFIKKKYYVMHLLYNEGVKSEKMKVMGVQIKKTTIPKPISKVLTRFIEEFLKGKLWNDIAKEVVAYKDILINAAITEIGLPKGVKNVETYTNRYNVNEPGLRLPGHVAAAMFYNKCLEVYGDLESPKITSGMKIKTFYLKRKFGYFKSIALPTDLKNPPAWFKEHFEPLVDRKGQLDRLVDKPLDSILNAIGKVSPSHKTLMIDELFEF